MISLSSERVIYNSGLLKINTIYKIIFDRKSIFCYDIMTITIKENKKIYLLNIDYLIHLISKFKRKNNWRILKLMYFLVVVWQIMGRICCKYMCVYKKVWFWKLQIIILLSRSKKTEKELCTHLFLLPYKRYQLNYDICSKSSTWFSLEKWVL